MNIQDQSFKITEIFEREIREICQPLFRQSDINYFHFCTFYDDGNAFTLVTNARWHDYFYKQDFQHHSQHFIEEGYCLTKARPSYAREVHDARNLFNIDNKFEITTRIQNGQEIFGFATSQNNDVINEFYFNNIGYLHQFIFYFKEKARDIIRLREKKDNCFYISTRGVSINDNHHKLEVNSLDFQPNRYFLNNAFGTYNLTRREVEVLLFWLQGNSSKEIAIKLKLSARTIESHISSLKDKLHRQKRSELFRCARSLGLLQLLVHETL